MNKTSLIRSIFYPRKSFVKQDENDILIPVEKDVDVAIRLYLINENYPTILYFHGNAELAQEYDLIAEFYHKVGINLIVADYRGYGLSTGTPNRDNLHSDSIKIFDYTLVYLKE